MNQQTETLKMALELLAVATFLSPELQKQRSAVIDTGLKTLAEQPAPSCPECLFGLCHCGLRNAKQPAQLQQEPVATLFGSLPVDVTPSPAQPQQEPVAWRVRFHYGTDGMAKRIGDWKLYGYSPTPEKDKEVEPLYTSPLQRKPLTDGDIRHIANNAGLEPSEITGEVFYALRCVADEAAHGIKE